MTIDNNCGREDGMHDAPGSQAEAHSQIALEQSALYAAKLAIARWINTSSEATAPVAPAPALARASWYAEAQSNFQEWLGRGGFAQYEIAPAELAEAPPSTGAAVDATPLAGSETRPAPTCID
jgi:hypothetical protein